MVDVVDARKLERFRKYLWREMEKYVRAQETFQPVPPIVQYLDIIIQEWLNKNACSPSERRYFIGWGYPMSYGAYMHLTTPEQTQTRWEERIFKFAWLTLIRALENYLRRE